VGVDPVSVALRPGGTELWVSNHVSDTVSVIDADPSSPTHDRVIDTIQAIDANGVTQFDEPVGIAFSADGSRAFVALSSRNQIAVIDADARTVTARINVRAQEPRAIAVRNGLLYVAAFESGNRTELSICPAGSGGPPLCTLTPNDLVTFGTSPNMPGKVKNIVVDPDVPDRDLFVYDVGTLAEKGVVSGIGTLLYGVAVSGSGRAYVTGTDARNVANGADGQVLKALGNRMFLNRVAAVTCTAAGECLPPGAPAIQIQDLDAGAPSPATALATPYGVDLSADDATLFVTAAGSSRLAMLDAGSLATLAAVDLGAPGSLGQQIPRGVLVQSDPDGHPITAYVLNTLDDSIAVVSVSRPPPPAASALAVAATIRLVGDLTPPAVRRGRIAFSSAFASTSGSFACESCHPDGNTDQLLWRIGGACSASIGCTPGDEPRSTMPVRGLKNTLPLHWDGTLGDPFGGGNGAVGANGNGGIDCTLTQGPGGDHACFRDAVNAANAGVMCDQSGACSPGGLLSEQQKDDEATYLASISYPPARSRRLDDTLSTPASPAAVPNGDGTPSTLTASASKGFKEFFTDQGGLLSSPDTCADANAGCHVLPLTAGTNSPSLGGFEVPTMRGMTDRFLQFSNGFSNADKILLQANTGLLISGLPGASVLEAPIRYDRNQGFREITTFGGAFALFQPAYGMRPLNLFQMFEEANSMGFSGALGRQVELNQRTTAAPNLADTNTWMSALELADSRGLVNLRADGVRGGVFATYSFRSDGTYKSADDSVSFTHAQIVAEAQAGTSTFTLTAALRSGFGTDDAPQPLLALVSTGSNGVTGNPPLPVVACSGSPCVASNPPPIALAAIDVRSDAALLIDGAPARGTLVCAAGTTGSFCIDGGVSIDIDQSLAAGLHLLQVQNPAGPLSEELPFCVGTRANCNS
jgi:YVTN family beta-propeller protein